MWEEIFSRSKKLSSQRVDWGDCWNYKTPEEQWKAIGKLLDDAGIFQLERVTLDKCISDVEYALYANSKQEIDDITMREILDECVKKLKVKKEYLGELALNKFSTEFFIEGEKNERLTNTKE